jgi:hypothetical protein
LPTYELRTRKIEEYDLNENLLSNQKYRE